MQMSSMGTGCTGGIATIGAQVTEPGSIEDRILTGLIPVYDLLVTSRTTREEEGRDHPKFL